MAAALAFTDWYWGARGGFFIVFALVSLITRLAARGRRSATSRTPQYAQPPFTQPPLEQSRIARPSSPLDGPRSNPQNPFPAAPSDRPRSTPLPDTFGD